MKTPLLVALAASALLFAGACKQTSTTTTSSADGGGGATGGMPADFGADVPMYPGATVASNTSGTGVNGKPQRVVVLETQDDENKARAFYAPGNMKGLTFHLGEGRPNNAYWYTDGKHGVDVRVTVGGGRKGTEIELKASQL